MTNLNVVELWLTDIEYSKDLTLLIAQSVKKGNTYTFDKGYTSY
jgi:hypothetical protein